MACKMLKDLLAYQLMLATCLLSTWFGYQLASQSPNPSWHQSFLLKSPQNITNMCHTVSLVGISCQLGAWDMVAEPWQVDTLRGSKLSRTLGKMQTTSVRAVESGRIQEFKFQNQNFAVGLVTHSACLLSTWFLQEAQDKAWNLWSATLPN